MIVCAGSGGVGKTTIAASLGVRAAQLGRRTLVLTVDPARRLATALGLDLNDVNERRVPLSDAKAELSAAVIDSKRVFDEFILKHANQADVVARIMKNRLYEQLSTTLSGSQEFTALERLLQATESDRYDLVILDTPPTKHAMDFLTAPQRINSLFQDAVTKWFMAPGERSSGFFTSLISRGTRVALKSLETLTGAQFIDELLEFFAAIRSIQKVLRDRSAAAHGLLTGADTNFVIVTSFDAAKLAEANYLRAELGRLGYQTRGVVINRAFPTGLPMDVAAVSANIDPAIYEKVLNSYKRFKDYYSFRYNLYDRFASGLESNIVIVRVPEFAKDVHGLADLAALATTLGRS